MRIRLRRDARPHCPLCRVVFVGTVERYDCPGCGTRYHADCADELGGCSTLGCPRLGVGPGDEDPQDQRWRARARRFREGARARRQSARRLREEHVAAAQAEASSLGQALEAAELVANVGCFTLDCLGTLTLLLLAVAVALVIQAP